MTPLPAKRSLGGTRVRGTRQAEALSAVLGGLPGFCSAQQIHAELRQRGEHIGLTTVYRHLQVLSEDGLVDTIRDASGETLYRRCESNVHHHHLICRSCGTSVEVEGRAVERWAMTCSPQPGPRPTSRPAPCCTVSSRSVPAKAPSTRFTESSLADPALLPRRLAARDPRPAPAHPSDHQLRGNERDGQHHAGRRCLAGDGARPR